MVGGEGRRFGQDLQLGDGVAVVVEDVGEGRHRPQALRHLLGEGAQRLQPAAEETHDEGLGQPRETLADPLQGGSAQRKLHAGGAAFLEQPRADGIECVHRDVRLERDLDLPGVGGFGVGAALRRADAGEGMGHGGIGPQTPGHAEDGGLRVRQGASRRQGEALQQHPFVGQRQEVDRHQCQPGQADEEQPRAAEQAQPRAAQHLVEQALVPEAAGGRGRARLRLVWRAAAPE